MLATRLLAPALLSLLIYGREKARTRKVTARMRAASTSRFLKCRRDAVCSSIDFKKRTLLKYTRLYFLKLYRWIITGMAIASNANKNPGKRNLIIPKLQIK